jgi:hypothetical protein
VVPKELVNYIVQGGLYNHVKLDLINYGIDFLDPQLIPMYDFTLQKKVFLDNRQTYVIGFIPREEVYFPSYTGTLFVDVKSLAFTRIEFELSRESLGHANRIHVKKVPLGCRVKTQKARYVIEYRLYNGNWNLYHATSNLQVKLRKSHWWKRNASQSVFHTTTEFVITEKLPYSKSQKISLAEASKATDVLAEQVKSHDLTFWGNNTVIVPDEPLKKTLSRLNLVNMDTLVPEGVQ